MMIVSDTSVILRAQGSIASIEWFKLVGAGKQDPVRVVIPLVVLDELENQKDRGENKAQEGQEHSPRVKARHALRDLAALFATRMLPTQPTEVPVEYVVAARPTVEVLEDPPGGHVRYPRADDELIRRAVHLRNTTGRRVVLVTYDVAMSIRAQIEELSVVLHDGAGGAVPLNFQ